MHLLKTLASSDRRPCPIVSCYIIFLSSKQKNKSLIYFFLKVGNELVKENFFLSLAKKRENPRSFQNIRYICISIIYTSANLLFT